MTTQFIRSRSALAGLEPTLRALAHPDGGGEAPVQLVELDAMEHIMFAARDEYMHPVGAVIGQLFGRIPLLKARWKALGLVREVDATVTPTALWMQLVDVTRRANTMPLTERYEAGAPNMVRRLDASGLSVIDDERARDVATMLGDETPARRIYMNATWSFAPFDL